MLKNKLFVCRSYMTMLIFLVIECCLMLNTAYGESVSSNELISNARQYNGKTVRYEGEVIGDIMKRGDHAWININDGQNAIGIWAEGASVKDIAYTGGYKSKGNKVEIIGIFHRACVEHGGDLDIHAQTIRKLSSGGVISDTLNLKKLKIIVILLGILLFIWILELMQGKLQHRFPHN
ncbi:MAG: DNA-binding protein [Candidatus Omnitrophica bacterium]|nr:DNA-binding protein [Candidatus Omnitrophota bacterium]